MKLIKCLRRHISSDYIGIVIDTSKDPEFYSVNDLIQNKSSLLNYQVILIRAVNGKLAIAQHDEPVVVYYLDI